MRIRYLIGAVVLAIIAYGAVWYTLAEKAEDRIDRWADRLRAEGYAVRYDSEGVSGFPYRLEVVLSDVQIDARDGRPRWRWRAGELQATVLPWQPRHVVIAAAGSRVSIGGGDTPYLLDSPVLRASVVFADEENRYSVDLGASEFRPLGEGTPPILIARTQIHVRVPEDGDQEDSGLLAPLAADMALEASGVDLGSFASPVLGPDISEARVMAEVRGRPLPGLQPAHMRAWAEAGGTVELRSTVLDWGELRLSGEGSVTVDEINRPLGAMTLNVRNPVLLIRHLKAVQLIHPQTAEMAGEVLGNMQEAAGDQPVELPLTMQNGALDIGPIHLLNMPSL